MADLNERAIKDAKPGDVLRDAKISGLHLRCFAENKVFYLYYRTKAGVERRPQLGRHGSITLAQARKVAQDMLALVAAGQDPAQLRYDARDEPVLDDLWATYWKRRGSANKSGGYDEYNYKRFLQPRFGQRKLSNVRYQDVAEMMDAIKDTPRQANIVAKLLSRLYRFAKKPLRWANDNPCDGLEYFAEKKRRRYMTGEEAARIAEALDNRSVKEPAGVAFIYLLILTGARRGEIAAAKWSDLDGAKLVLSAHKTDDSGEPRTIFLPQVALDVLAKLPRTTGTITGIKSPAKLWRAVRKEAGCENLRIHDLRHSFASAAISAGYTLAQIGELLGHKSTQTTKRYAHLVEEAAHAAATITADRIVAGMKRKEMV